MKIRIYTTGTLKEIEKEMREDGTDCFCKKYSTYRDRNKGYCCTCRPDECRPVTIEVKEAK